MANNMDITTNKLKLVAKKKQAVLITVISSEWKNVFLDPIRFAIFIHIGTAAKHVKKKASPVKAVTSIGKPKTSKT